MIRIIQKHDQAGLEELLEHLQSRSVSLDSELVGAVAAIVKDVRERGDEALLEYSERFDGVRVSPSELRLGEDELRRYAARVDERVVSSLRDAIANIRRFHLRQIEASWEMSPTEGITLGQRITPIERVGLYVPGGTAAYPSSVIMNVVPAQIAGVERILVSTPPRALAENPAVATALLELGITEIYAVGGAQAIAAMTYGTETVPAVDKITGPGNKYVAAAKKLVFGDVGIDAIAGPSEVVIVADNSARADFVAADLLAQAEHGEDASALLITTSDDLAKAVIGELELQLEDLPRRTVAGHSLTEYGAIVLVEDTGEACELINKLAPEHVEVITRDDAAVAAKLRHAGAIFLGAFTPEAVGDYFAGPNHVLPTQRTARFSSALGVYDFMKRTSVLRYSQAALAESSSRIAALAEAEGLHAHAQSVSIRNEGRKS
jgi:histidinol dehydrogenase